RNQQPFGNKHLHAGLKRQRRARPLNIPAILARFGIKGLDAVVGAAHHHHSATHHGRYDDRTGSPRAPLVGTACVVGDHGTVACGHRGGVAIGARTRRQRDVGGGTPKYTTRSKIDLRYGIGGGGKDRLAHHGGRKTIAATATDGRRPAHRRSHLGVILCELHGLVTGVAAGKHRASTQREQTDRNK